MKPKALVLVLAAMCALAGAAWAAAKSAPAAPAAKAEAAPRLSEASLACLECHAAATPGIVADWKRSRHARTSPAQALARPEASRRISTKQPPADIKDFAVGCAECHARLSREHPDSFEHDAHRVHTVATPRDCAQCHPQEVDQYGRNLMSHAYGNLVNNPLYMDLAAQINGVMTSDGDKVGQSPPDAQTQADSCLACHGTEVKVVGSEPRATDFGDMTFPRLSGWPNHGVGRKNPDGTIGSCAACHSRHQFSIAMARSPYTCAECHKGPDVPAYKVYQVSKHGLIYFAMAKGWDMEAVPWTPGRDFTAPTCAACHVSALSDAEGNPVAARTHQMGDRIYQRLLGLVYSAPHPKQPDTSLIRSADGLPLPTSLDGRPASAFLIDAAEQAQRKERLTKVCRACHSQGWVEGHFALLDHTIATSNAQTLAATRLMQHIWQKGLAQGPGQKASPFDEYIERLWVGEWLLHANAVRFAAAMMGPDVGVFDGGRWESTLNLRRMRDWLETRQQGK